MKFKLGRFSAYKPDVDPVDILKAIFLFIDKDKMYDSNPASLQKFFLNMKAKFPQLFQDIYFNDDTWLAYSREIDWAYVRTQEDQTTKRPNPDFYQFKVTASDDRLKKEIKGKFSKVQKADLKKIAKQFEQEIAANIS